MRAGWEIERRGESTHPQRTSWVATEIHQIEDTRREAVNNCAIPKLRQVDNHAWEVARGRNYAEHVGNPPHMRGRSMWKAILAFGATTHGEDIP